MSEVLIVTETPVRSGHHRSIIDAVFRAHGVQYTLTSVMPAMPDKELRKVKPEQWLEQTARLHEEARAHKKVLTCGTLSSAAFFQAPKSVPVTKVRGRGYMAKVGRAKRYTIATFNPSTVVKDTDFFRDFCFDIEKLCNNTGPLPQPEIEIQMLETKKDLRLLKTLHDYDFISCDIETTSLSAWDAEILGIGFAALREGDKGYVLVVPQKYIGEEVLKFLTAYKGTTVFHNLMFDIQHLWRHYGKFKIQKLADTMLMNWSLDERPFNRYRSHGLDLLQRLHFDAPPKSVSMKAWLEEYFREEPNQAEVDEYIKTLCEEHPEKARSIWRKAYEIEHGEEPVWRGRKVGRDIEIEEIEDYLLHPAVCPKHLLLPPSKERKAQMWEEMMRYMGEDCYSTARLFPLLKKRMLEESERLWHLHEAYLVPAAQMFAQMRINGAPVNIPYLLQMKAHLEEVLEAEMANIQEIVDEFTNHAELRKEDQEFNPNSSKMVKEVLYNAGDEGGLGLAMPKGVGRYAYKRGVDEVTTNSDTLKVLARQVAKEWPAASKLINLILSYRVKSKIVGTYIDGILERVDPDGRIRGDFNLHGTATARVSSSNPNLQNIPDVSHVGYDIRKAYVPTEGWTILEADYSQLELRVAALFSQDHLLLEAYRNGADIHQEVALMLWNKPKEEITKYERYLAKCMNFGVIYGRGAKSIATGPEMDNLVEMSGRSWGNKEIEAYFDKFKVGYKDLFDWMDLVKKDSMAKQYVENPLGHRRRFDLILESERGHIERQTVNTPIQGFAAMMTIWACVQLDQKFDPEKQRLLFTVHDSIMCECLAEKKIIQQTADLIRGTMEDISTIPDPIMSLPAMPASPHQEGDRLLWNLPFVADVVVGPSWGECKDEAEHYVVRNPDDDLETVA